MVRVCGSAAASARAHTSAAVSAHASAAPSRDGRRAVSRAGSNPEAAGGAGKGWRQAVLGMLVAAGLVLALAVAPPQASARQLAAVEAAPATLEMKARPACSCLGSLTVACVCAASTHAAEGWQASKAVRLQRVEDNYTVFLIMVCRSAAVCWSAAAVRANS